MQATIYTIEDAAQMLSLHEETLRRAYRRGDLKAALIGRRLRISEPELERFWTSNGGGQLWNKAKKKKAEPSGKAADKATPKASKVKKKITGKKARA